MRSRMRPYYRGSDRTKDGDIQRRSWREGPHPRGTADRRPWFGLCAELPRRSDWRLCAELRAGPHRLLADVRPEGGARCVSSARRDLCGGRGVILVPTATSRLAILPPPSHLRLCAYVSRWLRERALGHPNKGTIQMLRVPNHSQRPTHYEWTPTELLRTNDSVV